MANRSELWTLVRWIGESRSVSVRELVLRDLVWKSRGLSSSRRRQLLLAAASAFLPSRVRGSMEDDLVSIMSKETFVQREEFDVLVVTVKRPELRAALRVFGLDPDADADIVTPEFRGWRAQIQSRGMDLSVLITMCGEATHLEMAVFLMSVLESCRPLRMAVLTGMAAGLPEEMALGDASIARHVIYTAGGRMTAEGKKRQPRTFNLHPRVNEALRHFDPVRRGWHDAWDEALALVRTEGTETLPEDLADDYRPNYKAAVVLSDEIVIEDGSLPQRRDDYHDKAAVGEMEAASFAAIFEKRQFPWIVARGIADPGEPDRPDNWQYVASLAAGLLAKLFITEYYFDDAEF